MSNPESGTPTYATPREWLEACIAVADRVGNRNGAAHGRAILVTLDGADENHAPTTDPADSLDALRDLLASARDQVAVLEAAIASAEADEQAICACGTDHADDEPHFGVELGPVYSPSDRDLIDALTTRVDALGAVFDEAALDETDAMLDMTGAFVSSTAAVLRIRAEIAMKHEQAKARWTMVQHGGRPAERARALVKRETWRQALELVDRVIGERLS